jgi:hypothetical protein
MDPVAFIGAALLTRIVASFVAWDLSLEETVLTRFGLFLHGPVDFHSQLSQFWGRFSFHDEPQEGIERKLCRCVRRLKLRSK